MDFKTVSRPVETTLVSTEIRLQEIYSHFLIYFVDVQGYRTESGTKSQPTGERG